MPFLLAQNTKWGHHQKKEFIENSLAFARAGGIENLEAYYEKAKNLNGELTCDHHYAGRDASIPQGNFLFLESGNDGFNGNSDFLGSDGRFLGVNTKLYNLRK